jgi:hypothetical protein
VMGWDFWAWFCYPPLSVVRQIELRDCRG